MKGYKELLDLLRSIATDRDNAKSTREVTIEYCNNNKIPVFESSYDMYEMNTRKIFTSHYDLYRDRLMNRLKRLHRDGLINMKKEDNESPNGTIYWWAT